MKMTRIVIISLVLIGSLISGLHAESNTGLADKARIVFHSGKSNKQKVFRDEAIHVIFSHDVMHPEKIQKPLRKSPIKLWPRVKGTAQWVNMRTLEFKPAKLLKSNKAYDVTVYLGDILERDWKDRKFKFEIHTVKQEFEVINRGLFDDKVSNQVVLRGYLNTSDAAQERNVEKVLKAYQNGKQLSVSWAHDADLRGHAYTISGLKRTDAHGDVLLEWDGKAIQVDRQGRSIIPVPPPGPFEVLGVRPVDLDEQYLEITFSDPVDSEQNLDGLIRATGYSNLKTVVHGTRVRVYTSQPFKKQFTVQVEPGIRNASGKRLEKQKTFEIQLEPQMPQVRFVGGKTIIPTSRGLTIPIEAVNLRAVTVEAMAIPHDNLPQFFQVNNYRGNSELYRVGQVVWKKTIDLDFRDENRDEWVRYGLDVTSLVEEGQSGMYRLQLNFGPRHIVWDCPNFPDQDEMAEETSWEDETESSNWDFWEQYGNGGWRYSDRFNPCKKSFYRRYYDHNIKVHRNVLVSDLGLIAKREAGGDILFFTTDLKTAETVSGVEITLMDFQQQTLGVTKTNRRGMARISTEKKPFLAVARKGNQVCYVKMHDGHSISVSHFDVSGATRQKGLNGYIYGERGVWRPGDAIHLGFVLSDPEKTLPEDHPVLFELLNPQGRVVEKIRTKTPMFGLYGFQTSTPPDAPTGRWTARVRVGGAVFTKPIRIETIQPNRLKINLDMGQDGKALTPGEVTGELSSTWLHGAVAKNMNANVEVTLSSRKTKFKEFPEYIFDDPARYYQPEAMDFFENTLDENGHAEISGYISPQNLSPGMLRATFKTRVFEPGGNFSTDYYSTTFHPYERYVGLRVPKGDRARGMLLTDEPHTVHIAMVDPDGKPITGTQQVHVELFKIKWRWWWEKGPDSLANYMGTHNYHPIKSEVVELVDGKGSWNFEIAYPSWGRYLLRVMDMDGNHKTGKVFYVDWPGWAGKARKDMPGGAAVLTLSTDKEAYAVGEKVTLNIPSPAQGRALVSIESGGSVLNTHWIDTGEKATLYEFAATPGMAPNVYAHVMLIQPHLQTHNDLPIRMYGVIPIKVEDPSTRLHPTIDAPEVFVPEKTVSITVGEKFGHPMAYTLAIVDEGLLDLTRFKTPNPWKHFFKKQALGVRTWDMYDEVAGAYGGVLERLLAIGGSEEGEKDGKKKANRFPPMVRFLGPFTLEPGAANTHEVDIPQYVGSVRVMVVASGDKAYGAAQKKAFVRKPVMILGTLPRVLGPEETVTLPISVFAMEDHVKDVSVRVSTEGPMSVVGPEEKTISFSQPGDSLLDFDLRCQARTGIAKVFMHAQSGQHTAAQTIELDVRCPSTVPIMNISDLNVMPGKKESVDIAYPGISGTNQLLLEVSRIPPINLGSRLNYLVRYPHGCVEQTTSSVFPQIYLDEIVESSQAEKDRIQDNVEAGIKRLERFQTADGGFGYWPGNHHSHQWSSNYTGHFLAEAQFAGYKVSSGMMKKWIKYQRKRSEAWLTGESKAAHTQAYRLYTLALAGAPDLGAMNRLMESNDLTDMAKWRLAAAYVLAGQEEAAELLIPKGKITVKEYREQGNTFGSHIRDKAMILETLCLVGHMDRATELAKWLSKELSSGKYMSTQSTSFALIAMARYTGLTGGEGAMSFDYVHNNRENSCSSDFPVAKQELPIGPEDMARVSVKNTCGVPLFVKIVSTGLPEPGKETAGENGISLFVDYFTLDGDELDPETIQQGTDFVARVSVHNTGNRGKYEEIAVSHLIPSGWEILDRLADSTSRDVVEYEYQDVRDDRVYTYLDLKEGQSAGWEVKLNASYLGEFYLPMASVETMYDDRINARIPGKWIKVVK